MVLEVAPGVLGGTGGGTTVTSGPLEAMQDTPVSMSATQQRLENKSYPSRSRTASEASSERRGSAVGQKKEKNRKSHQEKEEKFTALIPRSILDEYPGDRAMCGEAYVLPLASRERTRPGLREGCERSYRARGRAASARSSRARACRRAPMKKANKLSWRVTRSWGDLADISSTTCSQLLKEGV